MLLYLILLPSLLGKALAGPVFKKEECAKGPQVWCRDLKTASKCGAVKHCQQTVWSKPTVKSIPCEVCKKMVTIVENILKQNGTKAEIESFLRKEYEMLPQEDWALKCKQIIESYLPVIINAIEGEMRNPEEVCSALMFCRSVQNHLVTLSQHQQELESNSISEADMYQLVAPFMANIPLLLYPQGETQKKPPLHQNEEEDVCQNCVKFVTDVQNTIKSNSSFMESLVDHLKEECDRLGPRMSNMCKTYISQYSDIAVQMMMHVDQQPRNFCGYAGFCTRKEMLLQALVPGKVAATKVIPVMEPVKKASVQMEAGPTCELCQFVIKGILKFLEGIKTKGVMLHAIQKVCSMIPKSMANDCPDLVVPFGPAIGVLLLDESSIHLVCGLLNLCQSKKSVNVAQLKSGAFCVLCKKIDSYLDPNLDKNSTKTMILMAFQKVSSMLPRVYKEQCDQFVEQYEPVPTAALHNEMDPNTLCLKIGPCPKIARKPLLGTEQCVWGLSYWCKNMETAIQCNAVEHCKHHVWN